LLPGADHVFGQRLGDDRPGAFGAAVAILHAEEAGDGYGGGESQDRRTHLTRHCADDVAVAGAGVSPVTPAAGSRPSPGAESTRPTGTGGRTIATRRGDSPRPWSGGGWGGRGR